MFSRHHIRFISLLAILFAIAQANRLQPRQGGLNSDLSSLLGGNDPTSSESSTSSPPTSTPSPTSQSSSSTPGSTTSGPPASTTPTSSPSTTPSPTSSILSSTIQDPTSASSSRDESTTEPPKSTPSPSVVFVTTVIDGSTSSYASTMTPHPTSSGSPNSASLDSSAKSSSSGMSSQTKRTVIGVVVGIGGAIVLGALFVVAWRIWGRKKNEDESDGLMGYRGGSAGHEKSGSISTAPSSNPFQTTLDQYHAPNRPVNASSNF